MRPSPLVALIGLLLACGQPSTVSTTPIPSPATSPQQAPPAAPAPTSAAPVHPPVQLVPSQLTPAKATDFRAALLAARTAAVQGQHDTAIASFEQALAIAPTDMRARCELGWAAFQKGDVTRARREIEAALDRWARIPPASNRERRALASCLYNRGRVAEQAGESGAAARFYARSLELRPNSTVQSRLTALHAGAPAPEVPFAGLQPVQAASLEALVEEVKRRHCAATVMEGDPPPEEPCQASGGAERPVSVGTGAIRSAAAIVVESSTTFMGQLIQVWLALELPGGWVALGPVSEANASGVGGTHAALEVESLTAESMIAGGSPTLVLRARSEFGDSDLGLNLYSSWESHEVSLCGLDGATPRCFGKVVVEEQSAEERIADPSELSQEDRDMIRETMGSWQPSSSHHSLALTLGHDGTLTIAPREGPLRHGMAGTFPLAALPAGLQDPFEPTR